ncbi:MAG: SDR family oxidoreductase [Ignavibacteria bacterium]|nr:SDR family oxidoreductase [Ignavibacteria bacterium]
MSLAEKRILLTGATGYVGGRLLRALHQRGYRVRALVRRPEFLHTDPEWNVEAVKGDVLAKPGLVQAMQEVSAAYYMVHSMGAKGDFVELDREGAKNFGEAARACGVQRIIYLGGLGAGSTLSPHLQSRQEVGDILRASGVPVIELRASIVIGSGSLSFEMIRALVERLPIMITPRWVGAKAQPIAITDLLEYLLEALEISVQDSRTIEIGGADQVSYGELMQEYAHQRGLRRLMIPVPVLTPRLSSLWLGLVTPLYARTGRKLVESLRHSTTVRDSSTALQFRVRPRGVQQAIADALKSEDREYAETRWSDSVSATGESGTSGTIRAGNRLLDSRAATVRATPASSFKPIQEIGGTVGWYYADWLWRLRGFLDLLVGGVGMRRGRRHPHDIRVGDVIDWWRVEAIEPDRVLRLSAEMKLPGRAWLEFTIEKQGDSSIIRQTAVFDPVGLPGIAYWYSVYPLHALVFKGMLAGIVREAEKPE